MTADERPDPDVLLAAIQKEESRLQRGRLKVFLGMAAGVGKTYAMLEAARALHAQGRDVVIGYVETHGRRETDALARDLPLVLRRAIEHRGVAVTELDLDAVLARSPEIVIVDELAHSNAPGSRHPKRYQDVVELLDAGISVYTTLNVQHVESRADTVRQVTGITVQETVPDSLLDQAEIELVDLAPEELLQRLAEGKVYVPDRALIAAQNFFRVENLAALRELALRLAADRVGQDVRDYMQARLIAGPWKTGHRLLVAVSHSPLSEQMIRWTRRLADSLECTWLAVHVESSQTLAPADEAQLTRNLSLARELGAQIHVTADEDAVQGIMRIARTQNVTQIVVGKPAGGNWLRFFRTGWLLQRLIRRSGDIDVHVVRIAGHRPAAARRWRDPAAIDWRGYGLATAVAGGATIVNLVLHAFIGYRSIALIYLLAVVGSAMILGRGPVILSAVLSAVLWNFLFLPPRFTLHITNFDDAMMFAMYFVVAFAMGQLVSRIRAKEKMDRRREMKASAMYLLTLELADATTLDEIARTAVANVDRMLRTQSAVLLPERIGGPDTVQLGPGVPGANTLALSPKELGVATWAFQHGKATGRSTDTLPLAEGLYLPLRTTSGILGVLGVKLDSEKPPSIELRGLLDAFTRHIALVLERNRLREEAARAGILAESERLSNALLQSISHELRTPIATIAGAVGELDRQPADVQRALAAEIARGAQRLNRLVENLLDMTRLQSGHVKARLDWCDLHDIVGVVLKSLEKELAGRHVQLDIPANLPLLRADDALLEQALFNLLLNAVVHTPPGTPVEIRASTEGSDIVISIGDRGPGISSEAIVRIFDKFYRGPRARAGGSGLGLAIVKGFVEAQGGRISAENRDGGGALFTIRMPRADPPAGDPPP